MTNEEALKWHRMSYQAFIDTMWDGNEDGNPFDEAFVKAISALEKQVPIDPIIKNLRVLGRCENCGHKKEGICDDSDSDDCYGWEEAYPLYREYSFCECGKHVLNYKYCQNCGQRIKVRKDELEECNKDR